MNHSTKNQRPVPKGQGALEYLLLIGGAVLIATIVLLIIISSTGSTNTIISNNLSTFQHKITLNASSGGPGGGSVCGDGQITGLETCDDGDVIPGDGCSATCRVEAGYTCSGTPSVCVPIVGGDNTPPAFSFSAAAPRNMRLAISYSADDAATGGNNPVHFAGATLSTGLAREATGGSNLATMTNAASFTTGCSQSGVTCFTPNSGSGNLSYTDNSSTLVVGQSYDYKMLSCDSASTPNCSVSSTVSGTPFESHRIEAEDGSPLASLGEGVYDDGTVLGLQTALFDNTSCASGTNTSTWTAPFTTPAHVAGHTYSGWARAVNLSAGSTSNVVLQVTVGATNAAFTIPVPPNTMNYTWVQSASTSTFDPNGGTPTILVRIPCLVAGSTETYVDKVLFTDTCTPTGDGTNCS